MADKSWKVDERKICGVLGGTRRGPDGEGQTDCVGTCVGAQIKRSSRGSILTRWIVDAKTQAAKEGQDWCLIVRKPGQNFMGSTAVVELSFLVRILTEAGRLPAQTATVSTGQQTGSAPNVSNGLSTSSGSTTGG